MSVTVTLNRVDLDAEARRNRALRAAELLENASWLFDELISERARDLIATDARQAEEREILHADIRATMGLKGHLLSIIQNHQAEQKLNERRERDYQPADHA